jgi:hypothetical protein
MPDESKQLIERLRNRQRAKGTLLDGQAADLIEFLEERLASVTESYERMKVARSETLRERNDWQEAAQKREERAMLAERQLASLQKLQALVRLGLAEAQRNYSVSKPDEPVKQYWDGKQKALGEVHGKLATMFDLAALQHAQEQVEDTPRCEHGSIPTNDPYLLQAGVAREPCPGCPNCQSEQAAEDHCPTCGQAVRAVTGDEGTSHYEGLERECWEQEVREGLLEEQTLDRIVREGEKGSRQLFRQAISDALDSIFEKGEGGG